MGIFDFEGKRLFKATLAKEKERLYLMHLPQGTYLLRLKEGTYGTTLLRKRIIVID